MKQLESDEDKLVEIITVFNGSEYIDYMATDINREKALELYQDETTMFFHTLEEAKEYENALKKVKEDFQKAGKINKGLKKKK